VREEVASVTPGRSRVGCRRDGQQAGEPVKVGLIPQLQFDPVAPAGVVPHGRVGGELLSRLRPPGPE
jgi:hypothetical protein